jgi:prolyl-tRNA editing enzyme YbaK/EbsC (Cys-tRNA(Pro) deacylase)
MNADGKYISVLRRDDKKLNFKKIKKLLRVKNLCFAHREKIKKLTNCEVGYVSLLNEELESIFDESILEKEFVYGGTGSPRHDLKIRPKDLVKLTNAQVADISDENDRR